MELTAVLQLLEPLLLEQRLVLAQAPVLEQALLQLEQVYLL
jgi:hypothetical protein